LSTANGPLTTFLPVSFPDKTGCKNFTRLHDFRDKPEATKCIKCRQRGRQNYFAKKGRGDVISLMPPANVKGGGLDSEMDHIGGRPLQHAMPRGEYDYYQEDVSSSGGPRVTSSRQVALQKSRLSKNKGGAASGSKSRNGGLRNERLYGNNNYIITDPSMDNAYAYARPHDHERANSFSSLLAGSYLPGDDGEGGGLLLGEDDDNAYMGSRPRSDTLLSISSVGLAGLGESLGVVSSGKQGKQAGRTRRGSEEWDLLASGQYSAMLTQDVFDNFELPPPTFTSSNSGMDGPSHWAHKGKGGIVNGSTSGAPTKGFSQAPEEDAQPTRKRRLSEVADTQQVRQGLGKQVSLAAISADHTDIGTSLEQAPEQVETRRSRRDTVEMLQSSFGSV